MVVDCSKWLGENGCEFPKNNHAFSDTFAYINISNILLIVLCHTISLLIMYLTMILIVIKHIIAVAKQVMT